MPVLSFKSFTPTWPCLLCGQQTDSKAICTGCQTDLPWNKTACLQCAMPMPLDAQRCGACQRANTKREPSISLSLVPFLYQPPIAQLIAGFKFEARLDYGLSLAELISEPLQTYCAALPEVLRPQALIPVPLHPKRTKTRGYDQALEISKHLSHQLNIPLLKDQLFRQKFTQPLTEMTAAQRRQTIRGAFAVRDDCPERIVLVDDVMTTGSTLQECAKVLQTAGAKTIQAWAIARTLPTTKPVR